MQTWQTRPTMIEGLKRRHAAASRDAGELVASCIDCGAHAHEWRRMLGLGARFFAALGDAGRMVVQHADACNVCGSDALVVTAR